MLHLRLSLALAVALGAAAPAMADEQAPPAASGWRLSAARWFSPSMAGTAQFDYGFGRPSITLRASRWNDVTWPDGGVTAELTAFGATDAPGLPGFIPAGGLMGDLVLERRWLQDRLVTGLGLRGLSFRRVAYGTLSARFEQPLGLDWLSLQAEALAGGNVSLAYTLDASAGLRVRGGGFSALAGFRALGLQCGCGPEDPTITLAGPVLQASYQF